MYFEFSLIPYFLPLNLNLGEYVAASLRVVWVWGTIDVCVR